MSAESLDAAIRLHTQGDLDGATACYRRIIDEHPDNAEAWHLLGVVAHQRGDDALAEDLITSAIALRNDVADYHNNLGLVLRSQQCESESEIAFQAAVRLDARHGKALLNLTSLKRRAGELDEAVRYGAAAVAAAAADLDAHINFGNALKDAGKLQAAIGEFRLALALDPDNPQTHWNLALALLANGEFVDGFKELDWRWRWDGFPSRPRQFDQPLWDGNDLEGHRILVHPEQGLGDCIQFVRYASLLRDRGGHVIVEAPDALVPLIAEAEICDETIAAGQTLPAFDVRAAFLDLPRILGTTLETVPAVVPYLRVPPVRLDVWREKTAGLSRLKVGLNWSGNSSSPVERFRQLPLEHFVGLAGVADVAWFSLQKGPDAIAAPPPPPEFGMIETGQEPLVETAALIASLDLFITSDTAVAHLAGALGKPAWVILHAAPDWRWMRGRAESPWYPTVRLFRQARIGEWRDVVVEVEDALRISVGKAAN